MENNVASKRKVRFRCVRDRSGWTLAVANLRQHEIHDLLKKPLSPRGAMLSLIHEFLVVRTSFIVRDNSSVRNTFQPLMQESGEF